MSATSQIYLVMDAGSPPFTARCELQAHVRRWLDTFVNPLAYTFWSS